MDVVVGKKRSKLGRPSHGLWVAGACIHNRGGRIVETAKGRQEECGGDGASSIKKVHRGKLLTAQLWRDSQQTKRKMVLRKGSWGRRLGNKPCGGNQ